MLNQSAGRRVYRMVRPRTATLAIGIVSALAMVVVGCTKIVDGTSAVDTSAAPSYRASVSRSVSASAAAASTQAVRRACSTFSTSSDDARLAANKYVQALNESGDTSATEGPAVAALNSAADTVSGAVVDAMPNDMRDAFLLYSDAARSVAEAISTHLPGAEYNSRVTELKKAEDGGLEQCRSY